jgi:S-(hydroxymethyl)mycothiol dehydrogenase
VDRGVVVPELRRTSIEEIEIGEPGPQDVVVRIEATGVCHSDLHVLETGWAHPLPILLGHEGAGVVESVGAEVSARAPGDRVVLGWRAPCGRCAWCKRGDPRRCRTPAVSGPAPRLGNEAELTRTLGLGTFSTRVVVHEGAAVRVPEGVPLEQACLVGCAVATGVGSVLETAKVWNGARVGVIGCGAVGLSVVQGARIAGAAEIYALDLDERKLEAAERFGATHTGPGERLDFVFDVVGRPETVRQAVSMLGHAGTLVYIGLPQPGSEVALSLERLFDRRLRILVSHGGDHIPAEDFPRLLQFALEGRLDLAGMVTKTIALEDVDRAFDELKAGDVIRSVIRL